ncbi:hypothetical protein QJS04_geneDACA004806 [Acorus gramineus]|uniref:Uncharacterized protein n=1 Tax=Acorus gramineus TaxID=55184 RepID=A0AAV9BWY4_ACOGR|nr:hypothetical protein QJS04_geneDACA004806 [Acorus gramineus]
MSETSSLGMATCQDIMLGVAIGSFTQTSMFVEGNGQSNPSKSDEEFAWVKCGRRIANDTAVQK